MTRQEKIDALARLIIAYRAWTDGEFPFAREVLAGAWDHNNRNDIAAVREKLDRPAFSALIDEIQ